MPPSPVETADDRAPSGRRPRVNARGRALARVDRAIVVAHETRVWRGVCVDPAEGVPVIERMGQRKRLRQRGHDLLMLPEGQQRVAQLQAKVDRRSEPLPGVGSMVEDSQGSFEKSGGPRGTRIGRRLWLPPASGTRGPCPALFRGAGHGHASDSVVFRTDAREDGLKSRRRALPRQVDLELPPPEVRNPRLGQRRRLRRPSSPPQRPYAERGHRPREPL
jgi:hypothetical protein